MIRDLTLTAILLISTQAFWMLSSLEAFGQTTYYYGSNGESLGHSSQLGGQTYYYGSNGQSLGHSSDIGNQTHYYGPSGQFYGNGTVQGPARW